MQNIFIKVLDSKGQQVGQFKLSYGENKIGRDPNKCDICLNFPYLESMEFLIYITNDHEVYLVHKGLRNEIFKDSTIPDNRQVKLKQNFPYEMFPNRMFYFGGFKFCLELSQQRYQQQEVLTSTLVLEDNMTGTLVLDDVQNFNEPKLDQNENNNRVQQTTQILQTLNLDDMNFQSTFVIPENDSSFQENRKGNGEVQSLDDVIKRCDQKNPDQPEIISQQIIFKQFQPNNRHQNVQNQEEPNNTMIDEEMLQIFNNGPEQNNNQNENESVGTLYDEQIDQVFNKPNENIEQINQNSNIINEESIKQEPADFDNIFGGLSGKNLFKLKKKQSLVEEKPKDESQKLENNNEVKLEENSLQEKQIQPSIQDENQSIQKKVQKNSKRLKKLSEVINQEVQEENSKSLVQSKIIFDQPPTDENSKQKHNSPIKQLPSALRQSTLSPKKLERKQVKFQNEPKQQKTFNRVVFSGLQANQIPNKTQLKKIQLEQSDLSQDFDLLVLNEVKRTMKFLMALVVGAEILQMNWIQESLKHQQQVQITNLYIPESQDFQKTYGISIPEIIQNRNTFRESKNTEKALIFQDMNFLVETDVKPSRDEVVALLKTGGAQVFNQKPKKKMKDLYWVISESSIIESNKQGVPVVRCDKIFDAVMFSDPQKCLN